ncbi:MAG: hypothetical protein AAF492_16645, partial [Verrucomicrobiota bacterium]
MKIGRRAGHRDCRGLHDRAWVKAELDENFGQDGFVPGQRGPHPRLLVLHEAGLQPRGQNRVQGHGHPGIRILILHQLLQHLRGQVLRLGHGPTDDGFLVLHQRQQTFPADSWVPGDLDKALGPLFRHFGHGLEQTGRHMGILRQKI